MAMRRVRAMREAMKGLRSRQGKRRGGEEDGVVMVAPPPSFLIVGVFSILGFEGDERL